MRMDEILKVVNVRKTFGNLVAVDNASLSIKKNDLSMIIGPNGSGKTTLINCITGYLKMDSGKVFYKGNDITNYPPHKRIELGLTRTFQIPSPFKRLPVLDNLLASYRFNPGAKLFNAPFRLKWVKKESEAVEKAYEVLELLNLTHVKDQLAENLSGGQLKLLEIGRSLMTDADTIVMDEPVGGVNPTLAHEIFRHIRNLIENYGKTFLIIEHRLEVAVKYVDYVYAMAYGKVIAEGKPEDVLTDSRVVESYLGTPVL